MPIVVPPFVQYQAPLVPLRGLWNNAPPEGDRFVNCEIDWQAGGGAGNAVQIALAGNSPVAISQIAAISVDNGRCGSDVQFVFPDSGFVLQVPGYNQGVYLVFTNALMFYVVSAGAGVGDVTVFQVLNSVPPPVAIQPPNETQTSAVQGADLHNTGSTVLVPASVTVGTLDSLSITTSMIGAVSAGANVAIQDGTGKNLWSANVAQGATPPGLTAIPVTGIRRRFFNGLNLIISGSTFGLGVSNMYVNAYYQVP